MKKIDWYIFKNFIFTFVYCILLFTAISVVVDISEKTDDFAKANLSADFVMRNYYVGFVPFIVSFLFPLFTFIAVIFLLPVWPTVQRLLRYLPAVPALTVCLNHIY